MGKIKKFERVIDISDWQVESPEGWSDISKVMKTIEYEKWVVEFEDGNLIECADTHILIDSYNTERYCKDLSVGDKILSKNGVSIVSKVSNSGIPENMYDIEVNSDSHQYYSNGLVSHNTTTVAAFLLHEALFKKDKTIGVLANKGSTSMEILGRMCKMFEELPWFLKPGVVTWNKMSIEMANGSKIFGAATSSSSIRGKSLNVIYLDEFAHIENDVEFFESTYPVISSGKSTKVIITSTPKGMNLFYKLWVDSEEGRNEFIRSKFLWYDHPERDEEWMETTSSNIGPQRFDQEYNSVAGETMVNILNPNGITEQVSLEELYESEKANQTHLFD